MKQQLWILNSSLLIIFLFSLTLSTMLRQKPPRFRARKPYVEESRKAKDLTPKEIESIYKYDLFGTFHKKEEKPSMQKLVTPIPKPKIPATPKPPKLLRPSFIPPIKITLKGIVRSSDEEKSICMVEDETKKERIFHVGDTVKDAQIIKISQNKITLLRANGQHEVITLRKKEKKEEPKKKTWDHVIRKTAENKFEIDLHQFPKNVSSIGELTELLSLLTVYKNGKPVGIKISKIDPKTIGAQLGFKKDDIVKSINGISTENRKDRMKIYDSLTTAKSGDKVTILVDRNNEKVKITYILVELSKAPARELTIKKEADKTPDEKLFKLSKLQQRAKKRREFSKKHKNQQQNVVNEIRQRLLENLKTRVRNNRLR